MALFGKDKKEEKNKKTTAKKTVENDVANTTPSLPSGGSAGSYGVILSPHVTEKGTIMGDQNKHIFIVSGSSNKVEVKKAIESLYKVKVAKVHIMYAQSKKRQIGRFKGTKQGFKKAIVTLKEGSKIDSLV